MARLKSRPAAASSSSMMSPSRVFAKSGPYDATTTAAIAHAAGISEPILYRHFKNKEDLTSVAIVGAVTKKKALRPLAARRGESLRSRAEDPPDPAKPSPSTWLSSPMPTEVMHGAPGLEP